MTGLNVIRQHLRARSIPEDFSGNLLAADGSSSSPSNWGRELIYSIALARKFPNATIQSYTVESSEPLVICLEAERQSELSINNLAPTDSSGIEKLLVERLTKLGLSWKHHSNILNLSRKISRIPALYWPAGLVAPPNPEKLDREIGPEFAQISRNAKTYADFIIKSKNFILCYFRAVAEEVFQAQIAQIAEHKAFHLALEPDLCSNSVSHVLQYIHQQTEYKARLQLKKTSTAFLIVCPFCLQQLGPVASVHFIDTEGRVLRKYASYQDGKVKLSMRHMKCPLKGLYYDDTTSFDHALRNGVGLSGYAIYALLRPTLLRDNYAVALRNYRNGTPYINFYQDPLRCLVTSEYCLYRAGQPNVEVSISGFELYRIVKNWIKKGQKTQLRRLFESPLDDGSHNWNIWEINEQGVNKIK